VATITELRLAGTNLPVANTSINEPINAPEFLKDKLERFGPHYDLGPNSHLYRFILALAGDSGAGMLKRELLYPRLQSTLEATHFTDLDRLYGDPLGLPRISSELYDVDPRSQALDQATWQEIKIKDAAYRARCLIWMRAIIAGSTLEGVALAAEAACGVECDIFERYLHVENQASDLVIPLSAHGVTGSRNEFVIIPRVPDLTQAERRRIIRMVDRIRPVNSLPTIESGNWLRTEQMISNVASSSDYFYVRRLVTGRGDVEWPDVDLNKGLWVTTAEQEAPTFAFMDRQESVTYLSIVNATASTEHQGQFSGDQRAIFPHLRDDQPTLFYAASKSIASAVVPVTLTTPWVYSAGSTQDTVLVNSYYPVGYIALVPEAAINEVPPFFWSSAEDFAPATETLTLDFGRARPFNTIDFEVPFKPMDILIEYDDNGTWKTLESRTDLEPTLASAYLASTNPWQRIEYHSTLTESRYVRLTFSRRDEPWPTDGTDPFAWSIEVRNMRVLHVISGVTDFIEDEGADLLGNSYRTEIEVLDPINAIDGADDTLWQSQPNPRPDAVESLYFDVRDGYAPGTQGVLDNYRQSELDGVSMAQMALSYEGGVVIDEIFIDPITIGPDVHIYYSNDDHGDWDYKLWTPIARNYVLKKGFFPLPRPVKVKYVKLEFSNLAAAPYSAIDQVSLPDITYRRYPSWVQDYFNSVAPPLPQEIDFVSIDPLRFGFEREDDRYDIFFERERAFLPADATQEIADFVTTFSTTLANKQQAEAQTAIEDEIQFYSPYKWQDDLIAGLDQDRALSRFVSKGETGWTAELPSPILVPPAAQSVPDLTEARLEKFRPTMFFPIRCRHGYQVIESQRAAKIAYFVAIKEVAFYRRDYAAPYDEVVYEETFSDDIFVETNEFTQNDWRLEVTP
jgi:hypothetical protein